MRMVNRTIRHIHVAQIKITPGAVRARVPHINAPISAARRENGVIVLAGGHGFNGPRVSAEDPLVPHVAVGHVEQSGSVVSRDRDDFHLLEHPSQVEDGIVVRLLAEPLFGVCVVDGDATIFIC